MTATEFYWLLFLDSWQINVLFIISVLAAAVIFVKALR